MKKPLFDLFSFWQGEHPGIGVRVCRKDSDKFIAELLRQKRNFKIPRTGHFSVRDTGIGFEEVLKPVTAPSPHYDAWGCILPTYSLKYNLGKPDVIESKVLKIRTSFWIVLRTLESLFAESGLLSVVKISSMQMLPSEDMDTGRVEAFLKSPLADWVADRLDEEQIGAMEDDITGVGTGMIQRSGAVSIPKDHRTIKMVGPSGFVFQPTTEYNPGSGYVMETSCAETGAHQLLVLYFLARLTSAYRGWDVRLGENVAA